MAATGNEAVTLSQLRTAIGSTGGGSATGGEAVTIAQAAQALGATPTGTPDVGGRSIRLSQLKTAVDAFPPIEIVPWSTGTDEQIAAMVAAADAGEINLSDCWSAGDARTVKLGSAVGTQNVQFVLTDPGHYTLANGQPCNFVVLQKDCLESTMYVNRTTHNRGGWDLCDRRTWCNEEYRNAIPASLRGIFKQFKTYAADNGESSTEVESLDYFALFSEKEVSGSVWYANATAESNNAQLEWFKTSSNKLKKLGMNGSNTDWWTRSPSNSSPYYFIRFDGFISYQSNASLRRGIAPFGCI